MQFYNGLPKQSSEQSIYFGFYFILKYIDVLSFFFLRWRRFKLTRFTEILRSAPNKPNTDEGQHIRAGIGPLTARRQVKLVDVFSESYRLRNAL